MKSEIIIKKLNCLKINKKNQNYYTPFYTTETHFKKLVINSTKMSSLKGKYLSIR